MGIQAHLEDGHSHPEFDEAEIKSFKKRDTAIATEMKNRKRRRLHPYFTTNTSCISQLQTVERNNIAADDKDTQLSCYYNQDSIELELPEHIQLEFGNVTKESELVISLEECGLTANTNLDTSNGKTRTCSYSDSDLAVMNFNAKLSRRRNALLEIPACLKL